MDNHNERLGGELLSVEEEWALIQAIQQSPDNCELEKKKLLRANLRFVRKFSQVYIKRNNLQHTLDELIEQGNDGIIAAAMKFDGNQGYKFISYAIWYVRQSIKQYVAAQQR